MAATDMEIKILVPGSGFPSFTGTATYINLGGRKILVDTGAITSRSLLLKNMSIVGLKPEDVEYLVLTHMHTDHYGNIDLFSKAGIYMTREEYGFHEYVLKKKAMGGKEYVTKTWKSQDNWKGLANSSLITPQEDIIYDTIQPFSEDQVKRLVFVRPETELMPGLHILGMKGHSTAHIGLFSGDGTRKIVITADAFPNRRWFDRIKNNHPVNHKEQDAFRQNLQRIMELGENITIIPGHDIPFNSETGEYTRDYLIA